MTELNTQIQGLSGEVSGLSTAVNRLVTTYAQTEATIDAKIAEVDNYLMVNNPERRVITDIQVGGSDDWAYPVFFQVDDEAVIEEANPQGGGTIRRPDSTSNDGGVRRLQISRNRTWNGGTSERPLASNSNNQAHLLLDIDAYGWFGVPDHFFKVKTYNWHYNKTAAILKVGGFALRRQSGVTNASGLDYDDGLLTSRSGSAGTYSATDASTWYGETLAHSCVYLRGGLWYRFITNWDLELIRLEDEDAAPATNERVIGRANDSTVPIRDSALGNTELVIKPIAWATAITDEPSENITYTPASTP